MLRVTNIKAGNIVHGGLELKPPRDPLFRREEDTAVGFLGNIGYQSIRFAMNRLQNLLLTAKR